METVTIRLPDDLVEDLRDRADAEYRSVSNLIRLALIFYLDHVDAEAACPDDHPAAS